MLGSGLENEAIWTCVTKLSECCKLSGKERSECNEMLGRDGVVRNA